MKGKHRCAKSLAFSDPRRMVEFRFHRAGENGDYIEIQPPESPRLANVRMNVAAWSRHVHNFVILDRSGDLMLAPDDATLWRKLREKMTCPTLAEWCGSLMPKIHKSDMLLECESLGAPDGLRAFVLAETAQEIFYSSVAAHTQRAGIPHRAVT